MSVETIAVVISAASLLLTFAAGFAWLIRRTDTQLATLADRVSSEIGELRTELRDESKSIRQELGERLSGVEREMVEVKIAVARLEGPGRHLVAAR